MTDQVTRRLRITGRVQGVFFRESMRIEAERLVVSGWVCNRLDGSVEAVVQGSSEAVGLIVRWAHRGPEDARVTAVEISEATGEFTRFEKRPTF
ncbi:MAG TPA: acylphosphatase [Usitatibacter sp.]|nr:acylphosphatase [Usitatibacter sp.]